MSERKKIVIKPFRTQVQMDPNYAEKTWKLLQGAIKEIHRQNASGLSFEELYRNAYNMVLHKYGDMLYKGLSRLVEDHLNEISTRVSGAVDDTFLMELNRAWSEHKISMLMIRDILMYMDRVYVGIHRVHPVYDLGLVLFRDRVARCPQVKPRVLKTALELILRERRGEVIDRGAIKSLTHMLIDVGVNGRSVYEEDFERPFLDASATFYRAEAQEFITSNSCGDYLKKAERRIAEEMERVAQYLDQGTEPKIKEVVEKELIATHMKTLLEMESSGLVSMVRDAKIDDLQRMYSLLGRVPGGAAAMRDMLAGHIKEVGSAHVTDEEKQKNVMEFVQGLLDLKDRCESLLERAFAKDKSFVQAVNASFEHFVNISSRSPEYVSLFIDTQLRKEFKGRSEDEMEGVLDRVITLFRYVSEKDVFERYYKQHLAKRLLLGRSVSEDAERSMIAKLKTECGYQFTSKLEGMFSDMKVSADTMDSYRQWIQGGQGPGGRRMVELNVSVLTTGFWPTQATTVACNLPQEIRDACESFRKFYLSSHSGRRLTWQTSLGTAEVKCCFTTRKYELGMTTYQMTVLMLFNDAESSLTFREIREATNISAPELKRALAGLCLGKPHILDRIAAPAAASSASSPSESKKDSAQQVEESDSFAPNTKFHAKSTKLKVLGLGQQREAPATEVAETRQKVDEDRGLQIEAAIVRTMKARKTLEHSQLVVEVIKQLQSRFVPDPLAIKKRIESLIEREYLERSKSDRKVYEYLA